MRELRDNGPAGGSLRRDLIVLGAIVVGLTGMIVLPPSGILPFMHSLETGNIFSIIVLACLMATIFVFLHKLGISLVYVEEIESHKPGTSQL
ncbi:MAG TPA: hypothetical protein VGQ03_07125 [Nitrososphaera sp.]|nr:hypothetical protein [Nitrososphaera sp.]